MYRIIVIIDFWRWLYYFSIAKLMLPKFKLGKEIENFAITYINENDLKTGAIIDRYNLKNYLDNSIPSRTATLYLPVNVTNHFYLYRNLARVMQQEDIYFLQCITLSDLLYSIGKALREKKPKYTSAIIVANLLARITGRLLTGGNIRRIVSWYEGQEHQEKLCEKLETTNIKLYLISMFYPYYEDNYYRIEQKRSVANFRLYTKPEINSVAKYSKVVKKIKCLKIEDLNICGQTKLLLCLTSDPTVNKMLIKMLNYINDSVSVFVRFHPNANDVEFCKSKLSLIPKGFEASQNSLLQDLRVCGAVFTGKSSVIFEALELNKFTYIPTTGDYYTPVGLHAEKYSRLIYIYH